MQCSETVSIVLLENFVEMHVQFAQVGFKCA